MARMTLTTIVSRSACRRWTSGRSGASYGWSTPVISRISPARAFGVEPFRVALLTQLQRRVDEDLDEAQIGALVVGADAVAVLAVGADQRHQHDEPRIRHQAGDFSDPSDVLRAVSRCEAEVGVQAEAQVVAVEHVRSGSALVKRDRGCVGERRLARSREPREPHRDPAEARSLPASHGRSTRRARRCWRRDHSVERHASSAPTAGSPTRARQHLDQAPMRSMPAAAVWFVVSSMSTKLPVTRLRR